MGRKERRIQKKFEKNFFAVRLKWEEKNEGFKRNLRKTQSGN